MAERLKAAIARARAKRMGELPVETPVAPEVPGEGGLERASVPANRDELWDRIPTVDLDPQHLSRNRIVTMTKRDPAHVAFDMLRTRLVKLASANGWRRFGFTSPTQGCGKTTVTANVAMSFARHPELYSVTLDLDLRMPHLHRYFGQRERRDIREMLVGAVPPEEYLVRIGPRAAVAFNMERSVDAAELLQDPRTQRTLSTMRTVLAPDIVLIDLPPVLVGDEALAFMPELDAIIMVAGAGQTVASEIEECESLLKDETNLLGVVLNKVDPSEVAQYTYGYGYDYGYKGG